MRAALTYLILMALILFSCTEKIDVDLRSSTPKLVVYGELSNARKIHTIHLSRTGDYFSNSSPDKISGAFVTLSDNVGHIVILTEKEPGAYVTDPLFAGVPGRTYRLNIEDVDIDGNGQPEIYEASSFMPPVTQIDSIRLSYISNFVISGWQILLYSTDPGERKDFYMYKVYRNQELQTDSISEFIFRSDAFFNGKSTNGLVSQFLFDNKPGEKLKEGDLITFEMNGITEEYYNFLSAIQQEISMKVPIFSGPSANVRSNISGNALGFFTAYSSVRTSVVVPDIYRK